MLINASKAFLVYLWQVSKNVDLFHEAVFLFMSNFAEFFVVNPE
jgi:hypothetical protein